MSATDESVHHIKRMNGQWNLLGQKVSPQEYRGFAGSSYIDYIAEAFRSEWINEMGRFTQKAITRQVKNAHGITELRHYLSEELYISEIDIAELLKAKAAIQAGYLSLLKKVHLEPEDLKNIVIAGGFGFHLTLDNAIAIGLLPPCPLNNFKVVGNSSLGGASLLLRSPSSRQALSSWCKEVTVVELNQLKDFEDDYLDSLQLAE